MLKEFKYNELIKKKKIYKTRKINTLILKALASF